MGKPSGPGAFSIAQSLMHSRISSSSICFCNSSFSSSLIQVIPCNCNLASKLLSPCTNFRSNS
uniref:Putative ovule protein n=1 Tax=Solanum chacoense TaxID=4108 RepID=A0A0V0H3F6_SOLCH